MSVVPKDNSFIAMLTEQNVRVECLNCVESNTDNVLFLDNTMDCPDGTVIYKFQCNLCREEYWKCPCGDFK